MRTLLKRATQQMRMSTVVASSVCEAVSILETGMPVDVILTDYLLGDGTGADVVQAARRLRILAPAVLVTATTESVGASEQETFADIVSKPFRLQALFDALEVARRSVRPRARSGTRARPVEVVEELSSASGE